jgi:hypothetical protein
MMCLTVKIPWTWAIIKGIKQQEFRTWNTRYRGPLLIHTSKHTDLGNKQGDIEAPEDELWPGYIVGAVQVTDTNKQPNGEYAWNLRHPLVFPFPVKHSGGHLLYDVPISEIVSDKRNVVGWIKDYLAKGGR